MASPLTGCWLQVGVGPKQEGWDLCLTVPGEHLALETGSPCGCVAIGGALPSCPLAPSRAGRIEQQHRHLLRPAYFPKLTPQHAQAPRAGTLPSQRPFS